MNRYRCCACGLEFLHPRTYPIVVEDTALDSPTCGQLRKILVGGASCPDLDCGSLYVEWLDLPDDLR